MISPKEAQVAQEQVQRASDHRDLEEQWKRDEPCGTSAANTRSVNQPTISGSRNLVAGGRLTSTIFRSWKRRTVSWISRFKTQNWALERCFTPLSSHGAVLASQVLPSLRRSDCCSSRQGSSSPRGSFFLPAFVVITWVAFLGYRYLRRVREDAAQHVVPPDRSRRVNSTVGRLISTTIRVWRKQCRNSPESV